MIDIDDFKHYNDTNGHPEGDTCLALLSQILLKTVRPGDFVARYGGEEFCVVLPATNKDGAMIAAEKIRSAVEKSHFKNETAQPLKKVSVSIGVATYPTDGPESKTLIQSADKALYRAKNFGKNRVVSYTQSDGEKDER
ncbi:MAG: hypothetical protein A2297_05900 [Elusimicrobia bacterium RIFOXYB2_FULL_48_7]|nr:MAG: hypothetical protein A2297_05900 [Elusimicrobia bacterium RIFOXYB2_FULL_48_7]